MPMDTLTISDGNLNNALGDKVMVKTNKRMAEISQDIAEKTEAKQELNLTIETATPDNISYEVESKRGLNTAEARLTARHKNRDRRNLGKEKSQRMHDKLTAKADAKGIRSEKVKTKRCNKIKKGRVQSWSPKKD